MKVLTIFLCALIGLAFGDQHRAAIGKDDLKAKEDAREDLPLYVKEAINLDQSKEDVQVLTQSDSSNETETDEKPSSLGLGSPLTSGAYEVKKKGKKLHLESRKDRLLVKHSAKHYWKKFRSFFVKTGKDLSIKTGRSNRIKRDQSEEFNSLLEPGSEVLHPKTLRNKHGGKSLSQDPQKEINDAKLEETNEQKLLDILKPSEQETGHVVIPQRGAARKPAVSQSARKNLLDKLPDVLRSKILIIDGAENAVLENYVKSLGVPNKSLRAYNSARTGDRELLKQLLANISIILPSYRSIRKGVAWNHTILHDKFREFPHKPSTALEKNEAFKKDELSSLDSFLIGSGQGGAPVNVGASKLQDTVENMGKTQKTGKSETAEAEEAEKRMEEINAISEEAERRMRKDADEDCLEKSSEKNVELNRKVLADGWKDPEPVCDEKVLLSKDQIKQLLDDHNEARRRENAADMVQLTWDPIAASVAQQKANRCQWGHSMTVDCKMRNLGQNMWTVYDYNNGGKDYVPFNLTQVTYLWADERKDFDVDAKTCTPGKACGHWQMLTSAEIRGLGCGYAKCPVLETKISKEGHAHLFVCDYYPKGSWKFQKGEACSKCADSSMRTNLGYTCVNKLCAICDPETTKDCISTPFIPPPPVTLPDWARQP